MQSITVHQLRKILNKDSDHAIVVDVRSPGEHKSERIIGTVNIPMDSVEDHVEELKRYETVYVHCRSGNRSGQACQTLEDLGVPVVNVSGGLSAWEEEGFSIVRKTGVIPLIRQVQIAAGSLVLIGTILGAAIDPIYLLIPGFVGTGLTFAGLTGTCGLGMLLTKMPWNN